MNTNLPRAIRILREERRWTQAVLGNRAGVSRETISRLERGAIEGMTIAVLDRVTMALGGTLHAHVRWRGARLDRLMDAAHAALQERVASMLSDFDWIMRAEVSFNHYGDRGRVDIVAFHPSMRLVLIVEIKSVLGDLQETLGRIDVKVRLGRTIASQLGWTDVTHVVAALVINDSRAARRAVVDHGALFGRFSLRGRSAVAWLRRPTRDVPTGLLWFANRSDSRDMAKRR